MAKEKRCFIITPIGENGSRTFRDAKGVIESSIRPVLTRHGFKDIKPAYEIKESGMIGNQIIERILYDDLVVANLTGVNPNVMYELATRHVISKPIIHICDRNTVLPFDIKDCRTIFYDNDMLGAKELAEEFEKYVVEIDFTKEYNDNPICNKTEKIKNIFVETVELGNSDILIRMQATDLQLKNILKRIKTNFSGVLVSGYKKVGDIFLIYIMNRRCQEFVDLSLELKEVCGSCGVNVFFIDDLKNS